MAGTNIRATSRKQQHQAERIAGYGAEQRRLKAAAAARREASAAQAGEAPGRRRWRPPSVADR